MNTYSLTASYFLLAYLQSAALFSASHCWAGASMTLIKHAEHLSVPLTTPPFLSPTTLFLYILCSSVIPPSHSVILAHHSIYTYPCHPSSREVGSSRPGKGAINV